MLIKFLWYGCWYSATNAYQSNFFGYQAGKVQQMLIFQISWVRVLVMASNRCYQSNFFGGMLVLKQQMLIYQISLVKKAGQGAGANAQISLVSKLVKQQLLLIYQISLVMVLVIMQQMLHTQIL
jgi:ribosomal protein L19